MVKFHIMHTVTETDFGDWHSWSSSALHRCPFEDESTVRRLTDDVVTGLRAAGIEVAIEESTVRTPYPAEW